MGDAPALGGLLAAVTVAVAACGPAGEPCRSDDAGYTSVVRFDGVLYTGIALSERRRVGVGEAVGTGTGTCDSEVPVRAIPGVPRAAAVTVSAPDDAEADEVFLAPGFLPAMASHPLHAELFDVRRRWTNGLHRRCRRSVRIGGVTERPDGLGSRLLVARRIVLLDGHTRYRGPRKAGLPYLQGGERLVVSGGACRGTRIVARGIRARR